MRLFVTSLNRWMIVVLVSLSLVAGGTSKACAELLAYEGFDYVPGTLIVGGGGGTGWDGTWDELQGESFASAVEAGSLHYTDAMGNVLITSGGRLLSTGVDGTSLPGRNLSFRRGDDGTSTWVSFLGQRIGERNPTGEFAGTYQRGAFLALFDLSTINGNTEKVNIGENTNVQYPLPGGGFEDRWFARAPGVAAGVVVSPPPASNPVNGRLRDVYSESKFDELSLVVMRIDHLPGNDNFHFWVNPALSVDPSDSSASGHFLASEIEATAASLSVEPYLLPGDGEFSFNRVRLFAGNSNVIPFAEWLLDEIRVGTTFADVTPHLVPEASGATYAIVSVIGFASRRRRRSVGLAG